MTKLPIPFSNPATYPGHSGVDFPQPAGTPFRASGSGVVTWLGHNSRGGYFIWVKYDAIGPKVGYHHMPSHAACPREGTRFNEGDQLGVVGSTGNSTGPHLHSEVEGYATTDGYWRFFDRSRVVGGDNYPARALYGEAWVKAGQDKLIRLGYDLGPWGADGKDGETTQAATRDLQDRAGLDDDGIYGPDTNAYADQLLAQGFPPFPLPAGYYFGPEAGPEQSVSGHHGYSAALQIWQQRMKDRGWDIEPDGFYGYQGSDSTDTQTGRTALAFQAEKGYKKDGLIGRETWDGAWVAPITPPTPAPEPTPEPEPSDPFENQTSRSTAAIVAFLATLSLPGTKAGVIAYQATQGIDQDGIWGRTSDGLAFPPAGSIHGVDYSFARPNIATMASRGVKLAGRYLWRPKYDDGRNNKGIGRDELAALNAAGIEVFFIYEEDGKELQGGFDAGVRVAKEAEKFLRDVHGGAQTKHPVYFNVDYDAPDADMPAILAALDGIASVIGKERVGLYAGFRPIKAAFDAGKIAWGFQTYAWSGGQWDSRAHLQQWSNGQWGGTIDFTRAVKAEYGQHPVADVTPDPTPEPDPEPDTVPVERSLLQSWFDKLKQLLGG